MNPTKNSVSRRQFLNYTLTGVGGFMGAAMVAPMLGFAVDPLLQAESGGDFISVMSVDDITETPQKKEFQVDQKDGWYETKVTRVAWIFRSGEDEILALSPVCTHLGCTVGWDSNPEYENEFFCPCHNGRYDEKGVNIPGTPPTAPLPAYETRVQDGTLFLSPRAQARGGA
ncbi:ubiquinol-cytochrome c reductase iron-sulfur subunit [Halalkalibacillus sediminis]|uniref:Rieske 2Fe-2S domain-containing protein n=1 Tax=Halalkalibacillus sediminis TaxID=2018042 RepID=UPI00117BC7E4